MAKRKQQDEGLHPYLMKRPALGRYLQRIGAELSNFHKAVIREKMPDGYSRPVGELRISANGAISSPASRPLPDYAKVEDHEAAAIAAEFANVSPPTYVPFEADTKFDPASALGVDVNNSYYKNRIVKFLIFWNASHDRILMIEQRTEYDFEKQCVPWSYWEVEGKGSWQKMEPDGPLPLFGLEQPIEPFTFICLHEGANTADAVRRMLADEKRKAAHPWGKSLGKYVHLGWPGGAWRWDEVDWTPLLRARDIVVTVVADNDKGGKIAAEQIALVLEKHQPFVVTFDGRFPRKFDLADGFPDDLFEVRGGAKTYIGPSMNELMQPATAEGWLEELNREYCVVKIGGKTRVLHFKVDETGREAATYMRFPDFLDFHAHQFLLVKEKPKKKGAPEEFKRVPVGQFWKSHAERRTYGGVLFDPESGPVVGGQLNLWRGFGVGAVKGDWSLMQDHINTVLASGDPEMADFIIKWSAWKLQNPGKPAEVALVFRGGEGTGKGFFARALCTLFGRHSYHISDRRHLIGNFNAHLQNCCLLFADEAFWPADHAGEPTLKRIITEPTLTIEPKGIDAFEVRNRLAVVMASNEKWVVPASIGARRFAVSDVADVQRGNRAYFDPLQQQLDNGGYEAMLYDLRTMDLGVWRPLGNIPQNAALLDQKVLSLKPWEQWLFGLCQAGVLPDPDPGNPRRTSIDNLRRHAREVVKAMAYVTDTQLGLFLKEFGCFHRGRFNGSRAWMFPPLAEMRAKWAEKLPQVEWEDPDQEDWAPAMTNDNFDPGGRYADFERRRFGG